jgi:C4-dicarboxylate transporter DctM subunit
LSELQIGGLVLAVTLIVLFSGLPIAWGLTAVAVGFLLLFKGPESIVNVPILMMDELSSFALLTIPLFILLGAAIGASAAGKDIYESLHRWLDRVPGGLVIANILACGVFSAICGSSPATAAAIGKAGVPEMMSRGVSPAMATGSICAGGTLGILIPPSITMILYGLVTETSIGRLFLAGVIPGVLLVALFSAYAWLSTLRAQRAMPEVEVPRYTLSQKMEGLGRVSPFIGIIVAIGYAMYGGLATPSEVAALSAVLALILVVAIYRQWRLEDQWRIFRETVRESSMILMIIGAAAVFDQRVPAHRRMLPAAGGDHRDGDADPHPRARSCRLRSDLVRGDPDDQHGSGPDHAAGRAQPLCPQGGGARSVVADRAERLAAVRAADVPDHGADRGLSGDRAMASRQDDELSQRFNCA